MEKLIEEIKQNLDENHRLSCKEALKIIKKYTKEDFKQAISKLGVKISDCELGQFGALRRSFSKHEIFERLEPLLDHKNCLECKCVLEYTQDCDMSEVRATLKDYQIDVKYCELGCFKEKKRKQFNVKSKIWIENPEGKLLFGKGKTDILELIGEYGSIAKAAKILNINYKKAWFYIQDLEINMGEELIIAKKGRGSESGSKLTPRAYELIKNYKILQQDVEEFTNKRFKELFFKKNKN